MSQMSETSMHVLLAIVMIVSLFIPVAFILMWGPQRFEKKEKR